MAQKLDVTTKKKIKKQNIIILSVSSITAFAIILGFALEFRAPEGASAEGISYDESYYQDVEQYVPAENADKQPLSPRRQVEDKEYKTAESDYKTKTEIPTSDNYQSLVEVGWRFVSGMIADIR
ncbi:hypothetical protein ACFL24_00015 [Patescibacteria group bacterium]